MAVCVFLIAVFVGIATSAILKCADHKGGLFRNGEEYIPWKRDQCKRCVCDSGFPVTCRQLPCPKPPTDCKHVVHAEGCCKYICLDRFLRHEDTAVERDNCTDVAIIGAGISGAYTAYLLRHHNMSVDVYEYANRIGGRLYTVTLPHIPDVNAELGGVTFSLERHPKLYKLIKTLDLKISDLQTKNSSSKETMYYLRGVPLSEMDLRTGKLPYNMRKDETGQSSSSLRWKLFTKHTNYTGLGSRPYRSTGAKTTFSTKDKLLLQDQSFETVIGRIASSEAYSYIVDTDGNDHLFGPTCASLHIPTDDPQEPSSPHRPLTLDRGMDSLPKTLLEAGLTGERKRLHLNQRLTKIHTLPGGKHQLTFKETITKKDGYTRDKFGKESIVKRCAKKVILAVPRMALESIVWRGTRKHPRYRTYMNSVNDISVVKIFLGYRSTWWEKLKGNVSKIVTDLPVRNVLPVGVSPQTGRAILLAVFKERDITYWKRLSRLGKPIRDSLRTPYEVTSQIVSHVNRHLAEIFEVKTHAIPNPISGAMFVWEDFPFGGAGNVWLPGYDWEDVRKVMMRPSLKDQVFTVGSVFALNDNQMWIEGAIERVDELIAEHFKENSL